MTQRELWRQLNHQFHGIKPSAKRSERELESYKRELSAKKKANADTPLGSMQMLKVATKVTSAVFMTLFCYHNHDIYMLLSFFCKLAHALGHALSFAVRTAAQLHYLT
jgi:hypothetical protein